MPIGVYERKVRKSLVGQRFGKLLVLSLSEETHVVGNPYKYLCVCDCGERKVINGSSLRTGATKSCGCLKGGRKPSCHPDRPHWCKGLCKECYDRILRVRYAKRLRVRSREVTASLKLAALTHYGPDGVLKCCWEGCDVTDIDMLTLDHINDDGAEHKRSLGTKGSLYQWAKNNSYPEGFQTLCGSHQLKKKIEKCRRDWT